MSTSLKPLIPHSILTGIIQPEDKDIIRAKNFIQSEMERIRKVLREKVSPTPVEAPIQVEAPVEPLEDIVLHAPELLNNLLLVDEYIQNLYIQALHQRESS